MSNVNDSPCNHDIHNLLPHFPNICKAECKKIIFYRKYTKKNSNPVRICCACCKIRQFRVKPDLIVCHWVTSGEIIFSKCEYCLAPLDTTRSIFQCSECIFSYFERTIYERNHGRNINTLPAFAFCRTHQQRVYA